MTRDELADRLKEDIDALHAEVDALPENVRKWRAKRMVRIAHNALNVLKDMATEGGEIQPYSGGEPKPPEEP